MTNIFWTVAIAVFTLTPLASTAAEPVAEYNFQKSLSSSVTGAPALVDLVDATNQTANTFMTATVDGSPRTVLHFPQFNGVALAPAAGLIESGVYTIAILFAFEETSGYRRLLDFKNGTTDNGVYGYNGHLNFYPIATGSGAPITADAYHQVVITRDDGGTVTGYVDGTQQISFQDAGNNGVVDENNRLRFFQDNTGGSAPVRESSAGNVARIRVYNVALSAQEVAALDRLPDDRPDRLDLFRIVAGLQIATSSDLIAFDHDGDNTLTIRDVAHLLRGDGTPGAQRIRERYIQLATAGEREDISAVMSVFSASYLDAGFGYVEMRNLYAERFDGWDDATNSYTIDDIHVSEGSATARVTEHLDVRNVFKPGAPREHYDTPLTDIWRYENGDWYIYGDQRNALSAAPAS